MCKRKGLVVATLVHSIVWSVVFLFFVFGTICNVATQSVNSLDMAISYMFIIIVGVGVLNSLQLLFSVRRVCRPASAQAKAQGKVALCLSAAASGSFYVLIILLFGVNKDELFAVYLALALLWLVCTVAGGVVLLIPQKKKSTADD